jgi:hypothetical protein
MFMLAFHLQDDEFRTLICLVFFAVVVLCAFSYERGRKEQREEHKAAIEARAKLQEAAKKQKDRDDSINRSN